MTRNPYNDEQLAALLVLAASAHEAQEMLVSDPTLSDNVRDEARRRLERFESRAQQLRG